MSKVWTVSVETKDGRFIYAQCQPGAMPAGVNECTWLYDMVTNDDPVWLHSSKPRFLKMMAFQRLQIDGRVAYRTVGI